MLLFYRSEADLLTHLLDGPGKLLHAEDIRSVNGVPHKNPPSAVKSTVPEEESRSVTEDEGILTNKIDPREPATRGRRS